MSVGQPPVETVDSSPVDECNILRVQGFLLDLTHQRLPSMASLSPQYGLQQLPQWIADLQTGQLINQSEQRAVLHLALRGQADDHYQLDGIDVIPQVLAVREQMRQFCMQMQAGQVLGATGRPIRQVVHLGVGGSGLGPRVVLEALAPLAKTNVRVHIVTGVDSAELEDVLAQLDPAETLFMMASKSLGTLETLCNAASGLQWLADHMQIDLATARQHHLIALTAKPAAAAAMGIPAEHIFPLWDWVGGRFSLWSSIGLPIALAVGFEQFEQLLAGARAKDQHIIHAPLTQKMPVWMAVAGLYNVQQRDAVALSVVAYSYRLRSFASYLQQLEMESNGKNTDVQGQPLQGKTAPVLFGGVGSDVQHSYFQLLHQGTWKIASDFIAIARVDEQFKGHANNLLANCFAQMLALDVGNPDNTDPYRQCQGGQPSSLILLPELNPYYLGMLIALYEHKVYVQGRILGINSFDQWGVELGKVIAKHIEPLFSNPEQQPDADSVQAAVWVKEVLAHRQA
ncbi:MAG: glucose-6-phosphate isomerase [Pseudomonadota bacterium]|nr:glucose-6-phosphate isomerase [Pseudomonadota bacterium]